MTPQEAAQLQQRVQTLESLLANLIYNGEYKFLKNVGFGPNAKLNLTGSLELGTSGSKVGFYGVAPVVRQATILSPSGGTVVDIQARTAINQIVGFLTTIGLTH